jgi:hypothetical protein
VSQDRSHRSHRIDGMDIFIFDGYILWLYLMVCPVDEK